MKKTFMSVLLVAVLLTVSVTPALAASTNAKTNPAIPPNAQVYRIENFTMVNGAALPLGKAVSPLTSGCSTYTVGARAYSKLGVQLFSYAWNIYWCYNGSRITSVNTWRTVAGNYGWSFVGDIANQQSGGVGATSYWHYGQGNFCFIQFYSCVGNAYPWVNQTVYGTGGYTGSANAGV
jgi:hypothetical protein